MPDRITVHFEREVELRFDQEENQMNGGALPGSISVANLRDASIAKVAIEENGEIVLVDRRELRPGATRVYDEVASGTPALPGQPAAGNVPATPGTPAAPRRYSVSVVFGTGAKAGPFVVELVGDGATAEVDVAP